MWDLLRVGDVIYQGAPTEADVGCVDAGKERFEAEIRRQYESKLKCALTVTCNQKPGYLNRELNYVNKMILSTAPCLLSGASEASSQLRFSHVPIPNNFSITRSLLVHVSLLFCIIYIFAKHPQTPHIYASKTLQRVSTSSSSSPKQPSLAPGASRTGRSNQCQRTP